MPNMHNVQDFDLPYNKTPVSNLNKKINKINKKFPLSPGQNTVDNLSTNADALSPKFSEREYPIVSNESEMLSYETTQNMNDISQEHINYLNNDSNINPERLKRRDLITLLKLARMKIN